jgi:hypothetical protein
MRSCWAGASLGSTLRNGCSPSHDSKGYAQNLHNVDFQRADMTALGYPDALFDAVVSKAQNRE